MKIKSLFLMIFFMIVTQSAFAARLTIYNETPYVQDINIYAGDSWQKAHRIFPNQQIAINAGFNAFTHIIWGQPTQASLNSNQPEYSVLYKALIPSSVTMLTGSFMLWNNGEYGINFNKNGASSSKVAAGQGARIK